MLNFDLNKFVDSRFALIGRISAPPGTVRKVSADFAICD